MTEKQEYRTETDSLGAKRVPHSALYGIQTQRALENFPISDTQMSHKFIVALVRFKRAAARVNKDASRLPPEIADAISQAATEVIEGEHGDQFPVDVFQTGSGTSTNMNVNEVLANRAADLLQKPRGTKYVHPNDHVNLGQSSNDVIPSALHLAALSALTSDLDPALAKLETALQAKSVEFENVVKTGRTHYQDAVPMRLGYEFGAFARQIQLGRRRLDSCHASLAELALGGTAVGTGLNAPAEFAEQVINQVALETHLPLVPARDYFEALSARDAAVETSGMLKVLSVSLMKIANDLRLLSSGPRCGLREINLPSTQPGSSIMPGKVNPVLPEAICMVAAQVIGNDAAITVAGQSGTLQLNVMIPLIAHNLLWSIQLLTRGCEQLSRECIHGISANRQVCLEYAEGSLGLATALAPRLGYDRAAKLAQRAHQEHRSVRKEATRELTDLDSKTIDQLLDLVALSERASPSTKPQH